MAFSAFPPEIAELFAEINLVHDYMKADQAAKLLEKVKELGLKKRAQLTQLEPYEVEALAALMPNLPGRAFKRAADPSGGKKAAVKAAIQLTTPVECKTAGYTAEKCYHTIGRAATGLKTAGYSAEECMAAGFEKCPKCHGTGAVTRMMNS